MDPRSGQLLAIADLEEKILAGKGETNGVAVGEENMNCLRHPDRRAISICQKFGLGYCEECCRCTDPRGYCKFRSQCIGWQVCEKAKKSLPLSPLRAQKGNPHS